MGAGAESPKSKQKVTFSTGGGREDSIQPQKRREGRNQGRVCCGKAVDSNMDGALEFTSGALLEVQPFGTPGKICPRDPPPVLFMCQLCSSWFQIKASRQTCWGRVAETPVACTRERE